MNLRDTLIDMRARMQEQATPRALLGLAILVLIAAYMSMSYLSGFLEEQRTHARTLARELALRRIIVADNTDWVQRAETTKSALESVESRFWRAGTPGIVAARLQSVIELAARGARLEQVRVAVQPTPVLIGERSVTFEASVRAYDSDGQFLAFLQALARQDGFLVPVTVEWMRTNSLVNFLISAPAFIEKTDEVMEDSS